MEVQGGLYGESIASSPTLTFTVTIENSCSTTISLNGGVDLINYEGNSSYNVAAVNVVDVNLVPLSLRLFIDETKITNDSNLCGPLTLSKSVIPSTTEINFTYPSNMFLRILKKLQPTADMGYSNSMTITLDASQPTFSAIVDSYVFEVELIDCSFIYQD